MRSTLHKLLFFGVAVFLSASAVAPLSAQSAGSIRGTVSGSTGALVPGASVVAAKNYLSPLASDLNAGIFNSTSNSNIGRTRYLVKAGHAVVGNNHFSARYFICPG